MNFIVLVIFFLLLSFFTGKIFFSYKSKIQDVNASIKETDQLTNDAKREEEKFATGVEETTKKYKDKVDLINTIILQKSFSWVEFLSDLENSLPDSSYITSLAPTLTNDSKMQLRFKVASSNLNDLLKFINNLKDLKFNHIQIISESRNDEGLLLSEVSLVYEKIN